MYQINDTVMYGSQGVCTISGTEEKNFGRQKIKYYILKPVFQNNSTIFVPVDNEALTAKMTRVISRDEIMQLIQTVAHTEINWEEDDGLRKKQFKETLLSGDRQSIILLIKAIRIHQQEQSEKLRRLHIADEQFLKEAEGVLYDEFALALGINPAQVLPFIMESLATEQQ